MSPSLFPSSQMVEASQSRPHSVQPASVHQAFWSSFGISLNHFICKYFIFSLTFLCNSNRLKVLGTAMKNTQLKTRQDGTSLVLWWVRIHLLMQGIWAWSLVGEDSTRHEQLSPVCRYCWAWALEPEPCTERRCAARAGAPSGVAALLTTAREKPADEDPEPPEVK